MIAGVPWERVRALCCRSWGMAPAAFEEASARGEIALADVWEVLLLEISDPWRGQGVLRWMQRERVARREEVLGRIQEIAVRINATADQGRREALAAEAARLNGELERL